VLIAGILVFLGFLAWANQPPASEQAPPTTASPSLKSDASGNVDAAPGHASRQASFAPTREGAAAAAVAYSAASQQWLYLTDDGIATAVRSITTPTASKRITEEVVAEVNAARGELVRSPGRVWWLVRPLAWRVEHFDAESASVSVWAVTVLSAQQVAVPQAEWITVTVSLVWVDAEWRVDAVRDTPGPTPINSARDQPWDAVPFDDALTGFTRLDGEPGR
jgi:hypothetical protein